MLHYACICEKKQHELKHIILLLYTIFNYDTNIYIIKESRSCFYVEIFACGV